MSGPMIRAVFHALAATGAALAGCAVPPPGAGIAQIPASAPARRG